MSALIKAAQTSYSVAKWQPDIDRAALAIIEAIKPQPYFDELQRLQNDYQKLKAELSDKNALLDQSAEELKQAYWNGFKEGTDAGRQLADSEVDDALQILSNGIDLAVKQFEDQLKVLERLAVELARTGLEKIFGSKAELGDWVCDALSHQLSKIDTESVLHVSVSAKDFSTVEFLQDQILAWSHRKVEVRKDPVLRAGECRIQMKLGAIELNLDQQVKTLRSALASLSETGVR